MLSVSVIRNNFGSGFMASKQLLADTTNSQAFCSWPERFPRNIVSKTSLMHSYARKMLPWRGYYVHELKFQDVHVENKDRVYSLLYSQEYRTQSNK